MQSRLGFSVQLISVDHGGSANSRLIPFGCYDCDREFPNSHAYHVRISHMHPPVPCSEDDRPSKNSSLCSRVLLPMSLPLPPVSSPHIFGSVLLTHDELNKPFDPATLEIPEIFWRDHQKWLEERGYMLRPRLRPGWTPSWVGTKKRWYESEDGEPFLVCFTQASLTYD